MLHSNGEPDVTDQFQVTISNYWLPPSHSLLTSAFCSASGIKASIWCFTVEVRVCDPNQLECLWVCAFVFRGWKINLIVFNGNAHNGSPLQNPSLQQTFSTHSCTLLFPKRLIFENITSVFFSFIDRRLNTFVKIQKKNIGLDSDFRDMQTKLSESAVSI